MKTTGQIVAGVRRLLRRPSDVKFSDEDIRAEITNLCTQYVQQQSLAIRDRTSETADVVITEAPIDYYINLTDINDFEEQRLEYNLASDQSSDHWYAATIVPMATWTENFNSDRVVAAFYGSSDESTPALVKINLTPDNVSARDWRLTYRSPLVKALQQGTRPPLPAGHLPMLEREAAILLMPTVVDNSEEWIAWMGRTLPIYEAKLMEQKSDWLNYLQMSDEPEIQPIQRFDRPGRTRRTVMPYVPAQ